MSRFWMGLSGAFGSFAATLALAGVIMIALPPRVLHAQSIGGNETGCRDCTNSCGEGCVAGSCTGCADSACGCKTVSGICKCGKSIG